MRMKKYKVYLKDGTVENAECQWTDLLTMESMLDDSKRFLRIGNKVFAKDYIAKIIKIENTEE